MVEYDFQGRRRKYTLGVFERIGKVDRSGGRDPVGECEARLARGRQDRQARCWRGADSGKARLAVRGSSSLGGDFPLAANAMHSGCGGCGDWQSCPAQSRGTHEIDNATLGQWGDIGVIARLQAYVC